MTRKTERVQLLVQDVLNHIPEPYGEDVIRDVCFAIENNPGWIKTYNSLRSEMTYWVVNNWIGKYTKEITRMKTLRQVPLPGGHIIASYTKLVS
jgi:hypothetical protein